MLNVRRGFRPRIRTSHVVAAAALVLITTGGATAAGLITGKDIKDGSVSTKDVKNGSLLLKDFKKSERSKLVGPAGPAGPAGGTGATGAAGAAGANGAAGASAFAPPPSGTVIQGGGILNVEVNAAGVPIRSYAPVPFTPASPFRDRGDTAPRNLWLGTNAATVQTGEFSAAACPGTAVAPAPTAGALCVYLKEITNTEQIAIFSGDDTSPDGSDHGGFYVYGSSVAGGQMIVRYVWAYKAP
jgi:hypothetical protein